MMNDLFMDGDAAYPLDIPDGTLYVYPAFFHADEADGYFQLLREQLAWSQSRIKVYGREYPVPRLSAWYADEGRSYGYSGLRSEGLSWLPVLLEIKARVEQVCDERFNSVLANLYRDGRDGVGWHADDEAELGKNPLIASLSLGQPRTFQLKHRQDKSLKKSIQLPHGSLLMMGGELQHHWLHQLPKSQRPMGERINLTFRQLRV